MPPTPSAANQAPAELQGALHSLYSNYEKYYRLWENNAEAQAKGITPPVFIVVCNNTNVSKLVFDYVAGWEKPVGERTVVRAGALPIFRNDDEKGGWLHRPGTILVDSEQLESGKGMSDEFKKIAAREIEEFKTEYRARSPGRDAETLTDEDLLQRGDEHRRQARPAGRTGQVRGQCFHAHRRVGRQHRYSHPRCACLRHAVALRAGGRPGVASHD